MKAKTGDAFTVRVYKKNGKFVFGEDCFMTRCAKRGKKMMEWVAASKRDRTALSKQMAEA